MVTRLGEGLVAAGGLTAASMGRTVDAIEDLVDDARRGGPLDIVAVGTAGLRQASNRDEFLAAVHGRCGVTVEVISGRDEARLAYMAAVSTLPLTGDRLLVFDSGGGSSQFTFGSADRIEEQFSVDVGAVRFAERFGLADAVPRETVDAALDAIAAELAELADRPRPDMVIAIGGTSTNLAAIRHGLDRYDPDVVHGTVVDVDEVDRQIEAFRTRSTERRREIAGLQPARAEVILAGACVVRTILRLTGQDAVTVSDRGLRHGVIAERFGTRDLAEPAGRVGSAARSPLVGGQAQVAPVCDGEPRCRGQLREVARGDGPDVLDDLGRWAASPWLSCQASSRSSRRSSAASARSPYSSVARSRAPSRRSSLLRAATECGTRPPLPAPTAPSRTITRRAVAVGPCSSCAAAHRGVPPAPRPASPGTPSTGRSGRSTSRHGPRPPAGLRGRSCSGRFPWSSSPVVAL